MLAAAFRLYHLTDLPPGLAPEEASLGLSAVAAIGADGGVSGWGGWPILHWLTVLSIWQLGHTALGVRLPAVIGGILYAPARVPAWTATRWHHRRCDSRCAGRRDLLACRRYAWRLGLHRLGPDA